ncbi:hypothetical protein V5O48_016563 [Marasmius crinis-equi]|uniref:Uncharacterized protein n=1 Tax=Marasmius crinis-equi TaxID=585013 RepID=A0ABR3ERI9_9AGAR
MAVKDWLDPLSQVLWQKCSHCPYRGPLQSFPRKTNLSGHTKKCKTCKKNDNITAGKRTARKIQTRLGRDSELRDGLADEDTEDVDKQSKGQPINVGWSMLLDLLRQHKRDVFTLDAIIMAMEEEEREKEEERKGGSGESESGAENDADLNNIIANEGAPSNYLLRLETPAMAQRIAAEIHNCTGYKFK